MFETVSGSTRWKQMPGAAFLVQPTSTTPGPAPIVSSIHNLMRGSITNISTASYCEQLLGEEYKKEMRALRIRALCGKYRNMLTPSEEFARQKTKEISLEG